MNNKKTIKLNNLKKYYGDKLILNIDDFEMYENEKLFLMGANGCGKSTLFKLLSNINSFEEGTMDRYNSNITIVLSGARGFYGYLSAYDNISYYLGLNNLSINKKQEQLNLLVERLNFNEYLHKEFDLLSFGNKQKCSLIAGILVESNFLLIDEPTVGLDVASRKIVGDIIGEFQGNVIIATHDLSLIEQFNYNVVEIIDGKLKDRVSASETLNKLQDEEKYYFVINGEVPEEIKSKVYVHNDGFYVVDANIRNQIFKSCNVIEFKVIK